MKITHIATSALLVSIFSLGSVAHASIDSDFKLCATKAMNDQNLVTKSIKVQNGTSSSEDLNHSFSQNSREYKMKIVTKACLLYTSPSPRDQRGSRMPSSA